MAASAWLSQQGRGSPPNTDLSPRVPAAPLQRRRNVYSPRAQRKRGRESPACSQHEPVPGVADAQGPILPGADTPVTSFRRVPSEDSSQPGIASHRQSWPLGLPPLAWLDPQTQQEPSSQPRLPSVAPARSTLPPPSSLPLPRPRWLWSRPSLPASLSSHSLWGAVLTAILLTNTTNSSVTLHPPPWTALG